MIMNVHTLVDFYATDDYRVSIFGPSESKMIRTKLYKNIHRIYKYAYFSSQIYTEIKIPIPMGHVFGKWYGSRDIQPVLLLHGWKDNCGSFDKLIPYLPQHLSYLALDLPGHGLSSRLPCGIFYHSCDIAIFIKYINDYFKWSKVSLLGHSLGAIGSFTYALLFPKRVNFLICLDVIQPFWHKNRTEALVKTIQRFLRFDDENTKDIPDKSYTYNELEILLCRSSRDQILLENCRFLLDRNLRQVSDDEYVITRDPRLKSGELLQLSKDYVFENAGNVTCPFMLICGTQSFMYMLKKYNLHTLDLIKKNNKDVYYCEVEGTHHFHLNNPECLQSILEGFFSKFCKVK